MISQNSILPYGAESSVRTIIFGDIHGCNHALRSLLEQIKPNPAKDQVVFLGDLFDRGPDSRDVLRTEQELSEAYQDRFVLLLGNHEDYLLQSKLRIDEETPLYTPVHPNYVFSDEPFWEEDGNPLIPFQESPALIVNPEASDAPRLLIFGDSYMHYESKYLGNHFLLWSFYLWWIFSLPYKFKKY